MLHSSHTLFNCFINKHFTMTSANDKNRQPFLAFSADADSETLLKKFAAGKGWQETVVHKGDIDNATEFLKSNPSPRVLFIDISTADKDRVSASLDGLADVCAPDIKVIISGKINEYSFYCWLVEVGVSNYLLKPFDAPALEASYQKSIEIFTAPVPQPAEVRKEAKIITVLGARGGVGATTIGVNLAWILANVLHQKTALMDFDPQLGTSALALDLEPSRGLRDALEKPDRIDGLFIDRVMVRADDNLSILSAEEPLEENIQGNQAAAETLLKQIKQKFSYIIIDLPRILSPFTRAALTNATDIICVTEYNIYGLRESLRYLEYCRDVLKIKPPVFVANRIGLAGKHQMPQEEFEKGLGAKILYNIPFVLDAHAAATAGDVLAESAQNTPAVKVLHQLAEHFAEGVVTDKKSQKPAGFLSFLKGKK